MPGNRSLLHNGQRSSLPVSCRGQSIAAIGAATRRDRPYPRRNLEVMDGTRQESDLHQRWIGIRIEVSCGSERARFSYNGHFFPVANPYNNGL